jgi:glycosyltransferase involved in cell wall biosynthesis
MFLLARLRPLAPATAGPAIDISIIVPARNGSSRSALLASPRASIHGQREVVVVDDGQMTPRLRCAQQAGASCSPRRLHRRVGSASPTHAGTARRALGEQLLFLDADVTLATDALARLAAADCAEASCRCSPITAERRTESLSARSTSCR